MSTDTTASGRLEAQTIAIEALDATEIDQMWRVFRRYYASVARAAFERDLSDKDDVILLRDSGDGSLQGFSTLLRYDRRVLGRRFVAVFSGDTIVAEQYWGQTALQRAFLRYVMATKLRHPLLPVYWFLISKGYKTYLLMSRNFPEHWPRHDRPTPAWQSAVIDFLARDRYGDAYDPERGLLDFGGGDGHLKDGVAPIDRDLAEQPDVAFFLAKNPGHADGDELCCIGRVDTNLWLAYMTKLARRALAGAGRGVMRPWTATS